MNRRTALLLSMLGAGALLPQTLWAQTAGRKSSSKTRDKTFAPVSAREDEPVDKEASAEEAPATIPPEPGFQWKRWPIAKYTRVASNQTNPQKALVDWIFKRTGLAEWHGDKVAVLSASRNELRAYNSPDVLKQVDDVVERFTNAVEDILSVHVQFIAAVDTRWRYSVYNRLTFVGSGPQGQQIWTMRVEDAALVLSQMQVQQGFRKLADQRVEMVNGQTLTIKTSEPRAFASGLQRDGGAGAGFQSRADKIEESVLLKLSPLLNFEGDATDAMIDLTVNTVRSFHRTRVITPRESGPGEMAIDVPEATQTRLEQTVKNWRLGQTLVISAGIHPGVLSNKGGWFNLPIPGTYPTGTEVLVFLEAETVSRSKSSSRVDDTPTESTSTNTSKSSRSKRPRNSDNNPDDEENPDK
jgi:hypothetical protein